MVILMNLLNLSAKIVTEINARKNKQGVIADTIAKAFGYKSHHAVQGDIKLIAQFDHKATDRAVRLIKQMSTTYSVKEIQFKSDLIKTSGDTFFDYYMNLATNEAELLYQLTVHQSIFENLVKKVDAFRDLEVIDTDDMKALIPHVIPENITYALCVEIENAEYQYMVYASFLEDIINMKETVLTFIANNL